MERPNGHSEVSKFHRLPSICEYTEFGCEEDFQRKGSCSKLIKTRNAFSTRTQRFEEDEVNEEKLHLLGLNSRLGGKFVWDEDEDEWKPKLAKGRKVQKRRGSRVCCGKEWKPKLAKGWKMQKRKVSVAWAKSYRYRQSLRSIFETIAKVLTDTPLLLLKTMSDAYAKVIIRLAIKCDQRMWYLLGARVF